MTTAKVSAAISAKGQSFFASHLFRYIVIVCIILAIGAYYILNNTDLIEQSSASTASGNFEAEYATLANGAVRGTDDAASDGSYVQLGSSDVPSTPPSPTSPPQAGEFQPKAPYYAAFYYAWYKAPTVAGESYSYWSDGHNPPANWFSNYMPIPPGSFDTASRALTPQKALYSTRDKSNFYWQIGQMARGHIEASISSWWGQSAGPTNDAKGAYAVEGKSDYAFRQIVTDFMDRSDNPYPNLRWTLYYEKEGFADPSVDEIVSDLTYIGQSYSTKRSYLRIGKRPVIFVYGSDADTATGCPMASRWMQARDQVKNATGQDFYVVLKLFSGYKTCASQPDSWHQYGPGDTHFAAHTPYSAFVSPGFWKNGDAERLARDTSSSLPAFSQAAANLVAAQVEWKLIQTWNEWGEGTSVEPGVQVVQQTQSTPATYDQNGVPFENRYIDVLQNILPALESGTGVGQ